MRFSDCHPGIHFCFFAAVLTGTILFRHPVYLALSFFAALLWWVEQKGRKGLGFAGIALVVAALFALWYGSYHHFGTTPLWTNTVGNEVTLESLLFGAMLGGLIAAILLWLACFHQIFTADEIVYLSGRLAPRLALFLAILFRLVPRIKNHWRRTASARRGIGFGSSASFGTRFRNGIALFSGAITWTLDSIVALSDAMQSRGAKEKGRTAYSLYRFDLRDRSFVVLLFALITLCLMAFLLGQTRMKFNPQLHCPSITPASALFFAAWATLCLLPPGADALGALQFRRSRNQAKINH